LTALLESHVTRKLCKWLLIIYGQLHLCKKYIMNHAYWAKSTDFNNPAAAYILHHHSTGQGFIVSARNKADKYSWLFRTIL